MAELQPAGDAPNKAKEIRAEAQKPRAKPGGWKGRTFTSPAGVPILVGRNRGENEARHPYTCASPEPATRACHPASPPPAT